MFSTWACLKMSGPQWHWLHGNLFAQMTGAAQNGGTQIQRFGNHHVNFLVENLESTGRAT